MIYADHAATAPPYPEVIAAVSEAMTATGNPSSRHHPAGRAAGQQLDHSRDIIASFFGGEPDRLTFTSGSTEAINLAMTSIMRRAGKQRRRLLIGATEHPAVTACAAALAVQNIEVVYVPVHPDGSLDRDAFTGLLDERCALVCLMLVNNETGVMHDIPWAQAMCEQWGSLLLCDASQAPLRCDTFQLDQLGCDLLVASGHKMGGPLGVGALLRRRGLGLDPLLFGGGQEKALRPGSENLPAIIGLATACTCRDEQTPATLATLQHQLEQQLQATLPGIIIHGTGATRAAGITSCRLPSKPSGPDQAIPWLRRVRGICASVGSSCASSHNSSSPVLDAMGIPSDEARNAIRISLGWNSRAEEIPVIVDALAAPISVSAHNE